jgi:ABC-type transport system involved in cytochrome c biogenesis permease subunit
LTRIFGGREEVAFSHVLAHVEELRRLQGELAVDPARAVEQRLVNELLHSTADITSGTEALALLPPAASAGGGAKWLTPADLLMQAFTGEDVDPRHVELLGDFEALVGSRGDPEAFAGALARFAGGTRTLAEARGEYEKVPLEVRYYDWKLISNALAFFILAFLLTAVVWLRPRARWLYRSAALSVALGIGLLTAAIVMRCIIRERPPVSTLYETVLFVTAGGALTALFIEWITRSKIALSAAATLGVVFLFIANGYETLDKRDTMPQLVAVLDTNFWLATHVTAITFGYAAGLLAALFANIYLVAKLFGAPRKNPALARSLATMGYGTLCFALIFSVVGTILGGIWANESWGRFWGWDPKENGALLICLSQLVILHARAGGYLRDFGVAMATAFGGTVIGFSWWGVNLLGVGLHSYGFTSGIHTALWSYYGAQWGLIAVAGVHHLVVQAKASAARRTIAAGAGAAVSAGASEGTRAH